MLKRISLILFLCLSLLFTASFALAFQGKVVGVSDGDTITVMHDGKGERVRVYGVDTPEKKQDFGNRAKEFTSDFAFGKTAGVESVDTDRYGRTVGIVMVEGKLLNRALIEAGMAWVYERYCTRSECADWRRLQEKARTGNVGLWSVPNPVPPWDFRKARR